VDAGGRPAAGANVRAIWSAPEGSGSGWAQTLPDGSFEVKGLKEGRYTVLADGDNGSFAIQQNVATGAKVTLALRPGGRLSLTVTLPSGAPAADVYPMVIRVDGLHTGGNVGRPLGATDAQGRTDMMAPSGRLLVWAFKDAAAGAPKMAGGTEITLAPGETASVAIRMNEGAKPPED
jgi:hypothetical protein